MRLLNKMEQKYGRYAIPNLSMYIILFYVIGYVIELFLPELMYYLNLEPQMILRGQIWRLVSWLLIPPEDLSIFTIIMLFLYFSLGTALERAWGAFRYNAYILLGVVTSVIGAFILYFCGVHVMGFAFSTYYINMSIFLAFAVSYPEDKVYLYFLLPIKMKWMGFLYALLIAARISNSNWAGRTVIIASLVNFFVYLFLSRKAERISPKEIRRKQNFHREVRQAQSKGVTKHKCAVCGRTELDGDDLEFRFCSKCDGNYEYCQDHLFSHEHVGRDRK